MLVCLVLIFVDFYNQHFRTNFYLLILDSVTELAEVSDFLFVFYSLFLRLPTNVVDSLIIVFVRCPISGL